MKHVILADLHSHANALIKILFKLGIVCINGTWINPNGYKICALGDICDAYEDNSKYSAVKCLNIVMELEKLGWFQTIMSNHLDKLKRWLNGNPVRSEGPMAYTVAELEKESLDYRGEVYTWICNLPLYYEFVENGIKYVCVHAYIDQRSLNKLKSEEYFPKEYNAIKAQCIYGITRIHGRVEFWKEIMEGGYSPDFKNWDYHMVAGHFHLYKKGKKYTILDSDNCLLCWIPSENIYYGVAK